MRKESSDHENLGQGGFGDHTGSSTGLLLGPIRFPPADVGVEPTAAQIPQLMFLAVGDALLLGLGVSFLLFGFPVVRRVSPDSKLRAWVMYLSIGYLMVSWWPHLNMHAANGIDFGGLLFIDYIFHLPLEVAGVALALSFITLIKSRTSSSEGPAAEEPPPAVSEEGSAPAK